MLNESLTAQQMREITGGIYDRMKEAARVGVTKAYFGHNEIQMKDLEKLQHHGYKLSFEACGIVVSWKKEDGNNELYI